MIKGYKSLNLFFSKNSFIGSYLEYEKLPLFEIPEICFLGRSNSGKSSLINKITKTKNLAKTSKTPGRTQAINFFCVSNKIILADLPGYGFAKISRKLREKLSILLKIYLSKRKNLKMIFLLIDSKIGIKDSDLGILSFFNELEFKFSIILTKTDKCSKNLLNNYTKQILSLFSNYPDNFCKIFYSSTKKNEGIADIQKKIYSLIK